MDASQIDLRSDQREAIDRLADQFEREFRAGKTPRIEEYLNQEPRLRYLLLPELLAVEIQLRQAAGERISVNEYEQRFPDDRELLASLIGPGLASATGEASAERDSTSVASDEKQTAAYPKITSPEPRKLVGEKLGAYFLEEHIGSGGMGDVYRGRHTLLDRPRAIKVIRGDFARNPSAIQRFVREAQATSDLRHPNIVTLHEVNQEGDTLYLVMELLEGEDLASMVARTGPVELSKAIHFVEQVAEGLRFAHTLGYVHRDVKPHNIFVAKSGEVKLLDLGLARFVESADQSFQNSTALPDEMPDFASGQLTQGCARLGTPAYMSPEQKIDPKFADARSDIYSLGRTLIYLLGGPTALGQTSAGDYNNVQPIRGIDELPKLPACVPESIRFVVRRMISPNPDERFPNTEALISALHHWQRMHGSPIFARTPWRTVRRRLVWITFALVLFSSMATSALGILYNLNVVAFLSEREKHQFFETVVISNFIFPIGIAARVLAMLSVLRPFSKIEKGTFDFAFLPTIKVRSLRLGLVFFAIGLVEWLIPSIFFIAMSLSYDHRIGIAFTTALCGLFAAVIQYFCVIPLVLKVAYPALFRLDVPDNAESGRLSSLSRQIIAIQLLATVLPFAAMIAYQFPPLDAGVGRPFIIGLMIVSLVAAAIITYLGRSLQNDIRVFQEILQTALPSHAPSDGNNRSR